MRIFLAIIALLCIFQGRAQTNGCRVGRVEGEVGVGFVCGAGRLNMDRTNLGLTLFAEARYNLQSLPIDAGLQGSATIFHRESDNAGRLKFLSGNILAVADYNFRPCRKVVFFAGMGLGYASFEETAPISFDDSEPNWGGFTTGGAKGAFCFMPRVGAEFYNRLRITVDYKLQERANNHLSISFGFVFGGGRR